MGIKPACSWLVGAMGLLLAAWAGPAAERREWVVFTNCQYVATRDADGDSFRVRCDTNEFNVRLYFVDAPEANFRYPDRNREQAEHFGITIDDTIKAGQKARDFTRQTLQAPFLVRTRWAATPGRGRYYAFIEVGTNSLAELLVAHGWARTKGVTASLPGQRSREFSAKLTALEAEARQKRLGVWGMAPPTQPPAPVEAVR